MPADHRRDASDLGKADSRQPRRQTAIARRIDAQEFSGLASHEVKYQGFRIVDVFCNDGSDRVPETEAAADGKALDVPVALDYRGCTHPGEFREQRPANDSGSAPIEFEYRAQVERSRRPEWTNY